LAEKLPNLEAFFIVGNNKGGYEAAYTSGFKAFLVEKK
jgi:hypothetical protein